MTHSPAEALAQCSICLIPDRIVNDEGTEGVVPAWASDPVILPAGVSFLWLESDRVNLERQRPPKSTHQNVVAIEPFRDDLQLRLLMVIPSEATVRINGMVPPHVSVLAEGDQFALGDSGLLLHVSTKVKPYIGPPPASLLERGCECSLCHLPIEAGSRVYICPFCNEPTHHETADHKAAEQPLECVQSSPTCSNCGQRIVEGEQLTYVPEEVALHA